MSQIKSKKRIKDLGEVYTNDREIENMLNLIEYDTDTTFLEPACGNGNFIVKIIENKLKISKDILKILKTIYAIDICEENIKETKERVKRLINLNTNEVNEILDNNFICKNFLKIEENILNNIDVVIGNPPYQEDDNGHGASAKPIYNLFIEKSIELNPKKILFIIPARWMTGGKGLDKFRKYMLSSNKIEKIYYFENSKECFPEVNIEGGICYFLWDNKYNGFCEFTQIKNNNIISSETRDLNQYEIFIKDNISVNILEKINEKKSISFKNKIKRPNFGINTNFTDFSEKKTSEKNILLYTTKSKIAYISQEQITNKNYIDTYKVIISEANGGALKNKTIISKPFIGEKNSVCSQSYLFIPVENKIEAENIIKYIKSKIFRFLLSLKKNTQHAGINTYEFIPIENNFNEEEFYKKYNLSKEEINFINSKIEIMN